MQLNSALFNELILGKRDVPGFLTPSDFHFLNQNVLAGAILFFWNQYSNIVRTKLSSTVLTIRVIIKK